MDSITLAAARMIRDGAEPLTVGAISVSVAVASNTLVKTILAFSSGGTRYGATVALGQGVALLAGAAVLLIG